MCAASINSVKPMFLTKAIAAILLFGSISAVAAQPVVEYSERRKRRSAPKVRLTVQNNHAVRAQEVGERELERRFKEEVHPFLQAHCFGCHGAKEPKAKLDLARFASIGAVRRDLGHWKIVLERLEAKEMPPENAKKQPAPSQRRAVIDWIRKLRRFEAERNAGDPGPVLPRRLSNAEYDYTIRDLTNVDIRPTREFPVDPANEAGFDNSGESLTMSPALLKKYFAAARHVADHLVLLPNGFTFAPHPAVTDTDRDKFAVPRIVDFYKRQHVDYADYFFAAWQHRHRGAREEPNARLSDFAKPHAISAKYLAMIQAALTGTQHNTGPLASLREMWSRLPEPGDDRTKLARRGCEQMREFVIRERKKLVVPIGNFKVDGINPGSQPLILWMDRTVSANRRRGKLPPSDSEPDTEKLRRATERFCSLFPDTFFVSERGRMYLDPKEQNKGRFLSAGFHLMVGYYRDDKPLYDLILDEHEQRELDRLWSELDLVTRAPMRQFQDFVYFERAESPRFLATEEFDFARGEDKDITTSAKLNRLAKAYVAKARQTKIKNSYVAVIEDYFKTMSAQIRRVEKARAVAEPSHLESLLKFTERAWRRPLTAGDCEELLAFYRELRDKEKLAHEDAIRDILVSVLISPHFCYRVDVPGEGKQPTPVSDFALASRLSYFLWSSMPDDELMAHAVSGNLHDRPALLAQTKRMLKDPRVRGLATEFGGHWLDFRRFEQHAGVNRERFKSFTNDLRQAMFEEPVRFFVDLVQRDGSVFDFLDGKHTFVNATLAEHYRVPFAVGQASSLSKRAIRQAGSLSHVENTDRWVRIDNASDFGRGGLLPMSVFLTKNSPGLRTSPVKRGYWVVRRLLGEQIPAPPPEVPELPQDEAKLGDLTLRQVLAKHREVKSCATCHERFDSIGLVFEGYGPIGERRTKDLGDRSVDTRATFPDGSKGKGVDGLRRYLSEQRHDEFIDNLCRKLLAYALGRGLLLSDELTIDEMKTHLAAEDSRFSILVETIVTSPQFLNKRGRDFDTTPE